MPTTSRFPWPQRTTAVAGVLLLIAAVLLLLDGAHAALPITTSFVIPLSGAPLALVAAIVRAAGFVVAAIGLGGELGIAGTSRIGRTALVAWGVRDLVLALSDLLPIGIEGAPASAWIGTALVLVFVVAALVAATAVVRARVLSGFARWVLLPVAIVDLAFGMLSVVPVPLPLLTAIGAAPTELVAPVLAALMGVALLLWSRTEAVKHRARTLYDAW